MSTTPAPAPEPCSNSVKNEKKRKSRAAASEVKEKEVDPAEERSRQKVKTKKYELSGYNKKQILNHLKTKGCNTKAFEKALSTYKVSKDCAVDFFQQHIEDAEEYVYQECESLCFNNINDWLKFFKECNFVDVCSYEHAIVMNAIAYNEKHPDPNDVNGIDFGKAYEFLANALMGLPQNELNKETGEFLAAEFDLLVEEANTDAADEETKLLKSKLQMSNHSTTTKRTLSQLSLDPLQLQPQL